MQRGGALPPVSVNVFKKIADWQKKYHKAGIESKIFVTGDAKHQESEICQKEKLLADMGISPVDIASKGGIKSTVDEAFIVKDFLRKNGLWNKAVLNVFCHEAHKERAEYIFEQIFPDTVINVVGVKGSFGDHYQFFWRYTALGRIASWIHLQCLKNFGINSWFGKLQQPQRLSFGK
jgi:hypothetical protein